MTTTRVLADSYNTALHTLTTARAKWQNTPVPSDRAINAEQWNELDPGNAGGILNRLIAGNVGVNEALASQGPTTGNLKASADRLGMFCSHYHQALDNGITRGWFSAGARAHYNRDLAATTIPDLITYDDIDTVAQNIVDGEAARQTAEGGGFKPMTNPTASEIAALIAPFRALRNQSTAAQEVTDLAKETLAAVLVEAIDLCTDIYDTVEYTYRKDPDSSSRRQKSERWGLVYVTIPDAPVPPTPTPTPPATPAH